MSGRAQPAARLSPIAEEERAETRAMMMVAAIVVVAAGTVFGTIGCLWWMGS